MRILWGVDQDYLPTLGVKLVQGRHFSNTFALVNLLSRDFVKLVLIANLVAWPLAYFIVQRWCFTL
jgi:putative ABC transport system permease protein